MSVLKDPSPEAKVLFAALESVDGRQKSYGPPARFMEHVADLWRAQFGWDVTGGDVAQAMILFKLARLSHDAEHHDSWVDISGYAAIGGAGTKKEGA
ncbi:conserved protein [Tepidicaulis marinus]|uniref:Conserved protein n=1 Tax=Tepidicaulis marinus TaxID=1333998 RepID=A0A081B6F2_9HYPH|nr:DUF6378 domain-containing protein [Tepidicaulis marinus]GAK43620.1 conserved protein [Tepidicaulis marinus]